MTLDSHPVSNCRRKCLRLFWTLQWPNSLF